MYDELYPIKMLKEDAVVAFYCQFTAMYEITWGRVLE